MSSEQPRDSKGKYASIHAARSAKLADRYSDLRTASGQRLKGVMDAITTDLGGQERLNGKQRLLLDCLKGKLIVILQISDYCDLQPEIIKDGALLPVLGSSYLAYLNAVRLNLQELYRDVDSTRSPMSLEDYLRQAKQEETEKRKPKNR